MSKLNRKINHKFNIGDVVYVLKDYTIIQCLIIAIDSSLVNKKSINIIPTIDENSISYKVLKLIRYRNKEGQIVSETGIPEYDGYYYHSSKVYGSVDELLSDLEKTVEIF